VFLTLTEGFPCFLLSCKVNVRVNLAKTGHGPHSSSLVCVCVFRLLFVLFCVLFVCKCVLSPGNNTIAVNKYMILYCFHFSLLTPFISQDYQLREKQARKTPFDVISYKFIRIFQTLFRLFFIPRRRNFYL
jgi:hypothetical protein